MRKSLSAVVSVLFGGLFFTTSVIPALAQRYPVATTVDPDFGSAFASLGVVVICFYCCLIVFSILASVFTIWMQVDVANRPNFENKTLWVVLMALFNFLAAVVYYFGSRQGYLNSLQDSKSKNSHSAGNTEEKKEE